MTTTLQDIQALAKKGAKKIPDIQTGYTVKVYQKIKEGEKHRIQSFEGLVIKLNSGFGADKSFTVRKVVEGIGVEKVFPMYSPLIEKIEVKKKSKIRRAKLYYMRDRFGKSARLKESFVSSKVADEEEEVEKAIEELAEQKAQEEAMETTETNETTQEAVAATEETAEDATEEIAQEPETPAEEKKDA